MSQLETYTNKLKNHDWYYMYADSMREFQRGKDQWMEIAAMISSVDPDYVIFNQYAPDGMKVDPATRQGAAK